MSIYLDLIEQFSENIVKQLFLISSSDHVEESFQQDSQKIIENLKKILTNLKEEKSVNVKLEDNLRELDTEKFKLQLQYEELDKRYQKLVNNKLMLESSIEESKSFYETTEKAMNEVAETLKVMQSQLESLESNISVKESEKVALENKKKDNEKKKKEALLTNSNELELFKIENERKFEEYCLETKNKISEIKEKWAIKISDQKKQYNEYQKKNFFKLFLINNSDEKISEFEIINILMDKQECDLDELKSSLDLPPILALRIIKQMEVKRILQINEETNTVSLSG